MQTIAVMTSGGDAPGMNTCLRAVVRTAIHEGLRIVGIRRAYQGMIEGDFVEMDARSVSGILNRGGTILKAGRSEEFLTKEGQRRAVEQLKKAGIEGIVCIGGDGSFRGAIALERDWDVRVVGVPGTIDNDLYGTDHTIGYATAIQTAMEAIDKIRDTADSHDYMFIVEVMGRHAGFIAEAVGFACGAEAILTPESPTDLAALHAMLDYARERGKKSCIVVVAEGDEAGNAFEIQRKLNLEPEHHVRVTVLGHIQRGGSPSAFDRILAGRLGYAAVHALLEGRRNVMAGIVADKVVFTPLEEAVTRRKESPARLLEIAAVLAT
ncbi:MAG: 6-phosphofructokinase [Candidatus Sumerlaeia bacterium]|nr:6-phosphofructokinase [Candidatus Sumerlaeia bacterium]